MRRRRKKRTQLSVSLFPFLAVLICTLGVLIVMLVMAVKAADDQANQVQSDDEAEKAAEIERLDDAIELQRFQARSMKTVRPDVLERLERSRANRSYLEDEIRKLKREFENVGQELVQLDRQMNQTPEAIDAFSDEASNQQLDQLKSQIALAETEREQKRESVGEAQPAAYVIVPHKGGGGTFRRPIYIECTKDAITLRPSGIRLGKDEFAPPLDPGNMLDSALLANREYWQRYDLAGEDGDPYPLIVVRPDGAETFVLARLAMKSWDDEFGYELVEADKTLDFGSSDAQLETEVREAIEEARRRQRTRVAILRQAQQRETRLASYNSRPGLTASDRYGGFVSNAGGIGGSRPSEQSDSSREPLAQSNSNLRSGDSGQDSKSGSQHSSAANSPGGVGGDVAIRGPNADLSLAKQRGANWALPSKTDGATGYLRPIRVVCGADFLELRSNNGQTKRIPVNGDSASAIDPLVDEIWKKIESWGISGNNSYWKPELRISVLRGGESRFEELKGLLYDSGLLVEKFQQ